MKRFKLVVAYDGAKYSGWQIQPNGVTIEEKLNTAITKVLGVPTRVVGASRTDAGVHAKGNVAIFDGTTTIPSERLSYAINQHLPNDIVVTSSQEVPADWHPRFQASQKTYRYYIQHSKMPNPLTRRNHYWVSHDLDFDAMEKVARSFVGTYDFCNFCRLEATSKDTTRQIYRSFLSKTEDGFFFEVVGSGFLYNMVRMMVGAVIGAGRGDLSFEDVRSMLTDADSAFPRVTLPAHALVLVGIKYGE